MAASAPLTVENTALVLIDIQERLFPVMHDKEDLLRNVVKLVRGARVLEVPIVVTEQYPKGLGPTLPELRELLTDIRPIEKVCFNCCDEDAFCRSLEALGRRQVLLAGIEAHICVYQTAMELSRSGYQVQVVGDGVSSRNPENRVVSLFRLGAAGIGVTSVEMALFELLRVARGEKFKRISEIVK
jgi:nicotinamidase-related amidase